MQTFKMACCCRKAAPETIAPPSGGRGQTVRLAVRAACAAVLWLAAYCLAAPAARVIAHGIPGLGQGAAAALEFFLYDTVKILLLTAGLIYVIGWLRAGLDTGRVRDAPAGRRRLFGCLLGALFGAVTPFCSCSSIPLFLGFTAAGIPVGVTMSFLITSPLVNELAVVLLWDLLGWKFTALYVTAGLAAGMAGGLLMEALRADRWLRPGLVGAADGSSAAKGPGSAGRLTAWQRHVFARGETVRIFGRIWKWVIAGVALGALLYGFVPENWFAEHFGAGEWWSVPAAVAAGIPLYSNVTGIVPVLESLLLKGLPAGTAMAFCMSAVAASIPEFVMLRQIMRPKMQAVFVAWLWAAFTLTGWLLNALAPHIL
ncbi:MAG: permease [Desulfovibrionaceae bacterium]|nr:permease [Desulfovibrionaceae bacterium]